MNSVVLASFNFAKRSSLKNLKLNHCFKELRRYFLSNACKNQVGTIHMCDVVEGDTNRFFLSGLKLVCKYVKFSTNYNYGDQRVLDFAFIFVFSPLFLYALFQKLMQLGINFLKLNSAIWLYYRIALSQNSRLSIELPGLLKSIIMQTVVLAILRSFKAAESICDNDRPPQSSQTLTLIFFSSFIFVPYLNSSAVVTSIWSQTFSSRNLATKDDFPTPFSPMKTSVLLSKTPDSNNHYKLMGLSFCCINF